MKTPKKLELKYLAAYLSYGLKIFNEKSGSIICMQGLHQSDTGQISIAGNGDKYYTLDYWPLKPILRPLSDLTPNKLGMDDVSFYIFINNIKSGTAKYCNTIKLFEDLYDVFGLIPAGLAIDINTLDK